MRTLSVEEKKDISGGASQYVYCPQCGYRKKNGWLERLFYSNRTIEGQLTARHGTGKYKYYRSGQEAHY